MRVRQPAPDLLSEVLARLRVRTTALGISRFSAPWGFSVPALGVSLLYVVTEGCALIQRDGLPTHIARSGDIVLLADAPPHTLRSSPGVPVPRFATLVPPGVGLWVRGKPTHEPARVTAGGGGAPTKLLQVLLEFAEDDNYLLRLNLPPLISVSRAREVDHSWQRAAIETIAEEAERNQQGYCALATRLGELLCIDVIRSHLIANRPEVPGWLSAANDVRLARALSAMHCNPERHWTVAELAQEAGMSRSSFTQHFGQKVGESPLAYLTSWRMSVALDWIVEGRMSIKEVADHMGYASEKAFSQAFRRTLGRSPSSFRSARPHLDS